MRQPAAKTPVPPQPSSRSKAIAVCTLQPSQLNAVSQAAQVFRLLDLPTEVVDMVLGQCIYRGDLGIMRTCRLLHDRSTSLLWRNRVIHFTLEESVDDFSISPATFPPQAVAMTPHLRVNVAVDTPSKVIARSGTWDGHSVRYTNFGLLNALCDPTDVRKTCYLVFKCSWHGNLPGFPEALVQKFESLARLETVQVEVVYTNEKFRVMVPDPSEPAFLGVLARMKNKPIYEKLKLQLESHLGSATWQDGHVQGGCLLVFSPKKFWSRAENARQGEAPAMTGY